jgi:D-ribose pyranose/furanose isomerase RbsD
MKKDYLEVNDYRVYTSKAEIHKAINILAGILEGIKIDNDLSGEEIEEVINWCNLHRHIQSKHPFSEIFQVIDRAMEDNVIEIEEIEDILWVCKNIVRTGEFDQYYNVITSSIQQLEGILHGLLADNILLDTEVMELSSWMEDHDFLKGTYPFDEIDSLLTSTLQDGVISEDEKNMLRAFFSNFIDTRMSTHINEFEVRALQDKYSVSGICSVSPEIIFENKTFCFTGTSSKGTRNEISEIIKNKGGEFNNTVTKKTDYLIVGGEGNPCWAFSCYGRKVEKAVLMRKEGSNILIIHESDFWDEIN